MEKVKLDPRLITGTINYNTPLFVVLYIGTFCKLPYNEVQYQADYHFRDIVNLIESFNYIEIPYPSFNSDDEILAKLIKFISPTSCSIGWYNDTIINGYQHLMSFEQGKNLPVLDKFTFGQKTSFNPFKLNELIVFRIVKSLGYIYDRNTSFEECCDLIERHYTGRFKILKNSLLHSIQGMDEMMFLKVYNYVSSLSPVEEHDEFNLESQTRTRFNYDSLKMNFTLNDLNDKRNLLSKIEPKTNYEAIIISAVKYDLDISSSSNPIREYENLKKKNYIPYCPDFSRRLSINRNYYRVSKFWSSKLLNQLVYSQEQLREFVIYEGFIISTDMQYSDLVSCLKSSKMMTNFTPGINPECEPFHTILLNPLENFHRDEIICFGIEDSDVKERLYSENENESKRRIAKINDKHRLQYTTLSELSDFFKFQKVFISPSSGEQFDRVVIEKLRNYCLNLINEKSPVSAAARMMISTIDDLKNISNLLDSKLLSLKSKIRENPDVNENVELFFNKTMEMGLYMRGWKVKGDYYPLKSTKTNYNPMMVMPRDKIPNPEAYRNVEYTAHQFVMDNCHLAYQEALETLKEIPEEIAKDIKKLHSLKFDRKKKGKEIMGMLFPDVVVNHKETLLDCMNNIYGGIDNQNACINTNSNWILFSSVWYMLILGYSVPFKIDEIDNIY